MNESRAVATYLVNKYAENDKLYPKVLLFKLENRYLFDIICPKCIGEKK